MAESVSGAPPGKPRRRRLVAGLRLVAFAACVLLFVRALASTNLLGAWVRIRALGPLAALIVIPFPFALAFDTSAWRRLLGALGRRVRFFDLYRVRLAIEAVNNSAPAGVVWSEAIAPVLVSRRTGVPATDAFAASTAKRWNLVRMHGAYVALATAFGANAIARASEALVGSHALALVVVAGALAIVIFGSSIEWIAARGKIAGRVSGTLGRASWLKRWVAERHHHFEHADAQLRRLSDDRAGARGASLRIAGLWLAEGFETFLILRLLGAPLGLVEVMSFDAALSVVRSAAFFAPGGIGVQDVGYLAVLSAYGVPEAASIGPAFILLKRAKEALFVIVGFLLLARSGARKKPGGDGAGAPPAPSSSRRTAQPPDAQASSAAT